MATETKVIGVLGGMGPAATADFYQKLIQATPAKTDQDHLKVVIFSNPHIPDRTAAIRGEGPDPLPALVVSAETLIRAGADFLTIPCVTAHHFFDGLQAAVPGQRLGRDLHRLGSGGQLSATCNRVFLEDSFDVVAEAHVAHRHEAPEVLGQVPRLEDQLGFHPGAVRRGSPSLLAGPRHGGKPRPVTPAHGRDASCLEVREPPAPQRGGARMGALARERVQTDYGWARSLEQLDVLIERVGRQPQDRASGRIPARVAAVAAG